MKDYYRYTRACFDEYNRIQEKIKTCMRETTEDEEEFIVNFCLHLAHALIKDTGMSQIPREELSKMCDIVNDVVR